MRNDLVLITAHWFSPSFVSPLVISNTRRFVSFLWVKKVLSVDSLWRVSDNVSNSVFLIQTPPTVTLSLNFPEGQHSPKSLLTIWSLGILCCVSRPLGGQLVSLSVVRRGWPMRWSPTSGYTVDTTLYYDFVVQTLAVRPLARQQKITQPSRQKLRIRTAFR